ncbi:MAG: flagellar basal body L-ring protein FlgH [Candidatus Delongbacteria bacterium]|nr:flagellar basal body L-ring protein FlgH [Candidatus Delongbacteria bacterium]MBN2833350.1 flagellar basal body L-ring protein FlgH [Candidatus Delongbacteria bacterium]
MKVYIFFLLIITLSSFSRNLSGNSLFSDHRARKVGDIVTVMINESSSASNEAKTTTSSSAAIKLAGQGTGPLDFIPQVGLDGSNSNSSSGSGKTERKGKVVAVVTAKIVDILPNGNILLEGNRVIEVNGEKQITTVSGMIRPQDIDDENVVLSTQIAGLEVNYTGSGAVADAEEPGIISRFFGWLF